MKLFRRAAAAVAAAVLSFGVISVSAAAHANDTSWDLVNPAQTQGEDTSWD